MSNASDHWPLYNRNQPQYYIWNGNIRGGRFFLRFCLEFWAFQYLGSFAPPPKSSVFKWKAQEPVKDRGPLLVPFGMSSCQCSEKRIEQVVNNMMIMALSLSLVFEFQTFKRWKRLWYNLTASAVTVRCERSETVKSAPSTGASWWSCWSCGWSCHHECDLITDHVNGYDQDMSVILPMMIVS